MFQCDIHKEDVKFYKYYSQNELVDNFNTIMECDLMILSVRGMGKSTQETAALFRKHFPDAVLVYCSDLCQLTDECLKTMPYRYFLKSYTKKRMLAEMREVVDAMKKNKAETYIGGYYYYTFVRIKVSNILYIENYKRGSIIHVNKEKMKFDIGERLTTNKKIEQLYEILQKNGFGYAHKRYLVNLQYVEKMLPNGEIWISDGTILTVSRSRLKEFRKALMVVMLDL